MEKVFLELPLNVLNATILKYDPFPQKDYYSLLAFFNNSQEVGYEGDVSTSNQQSILTYITG